MRLVEATAAQKHERDRLTFEAWGRGLDAAGYAAREARLRAHPWTRAGMQTWLLRDEAGETLASAESFRMRSRLRHAGEERWGRSFGVATVYTEARFRGRGHATRLMSLMVERFAGEEEAHAAILYSDVGAEIYARSGYVARPATDRVFAPLEADPRGEADALFGEEALAGELEQVPVPGDAFLVWPEASQLDWHLERERAYAELLDRPRPEACGARAGGARIFWAADFKNDRLVVLLLSAGEPAEAQALLGAARAVARRAGLREVRLWDGADEVDWSRVAEPGRVEPRDGGLPMLAPLRPKVDPLEWRRVLRALWV